MGTERRDKFVQAVEALSVAFVVVSSIALSVSIDFAFSLERVELHPGWSHSSLRNIASAVGDPYPHDPSFREAVIWVCDPTITLTRQTWDRIGRAVGVRTGVTARFSWRWWIPGDAGCSSLSRVNVDM